ncbi:SLC13 family permease [candidate division CSSED10-310 bacterium]|uniref:SLC13 family permease n=1 Tax=candidate division CSSED10-310 bacterium TaxID=2855610 RepID=A0ABV6Z3W4_UNCC1
MNEHVKKQKVTGYDKYINWKLFSIPVGLLILIILIPTPQSMLDVGVEYSLGTRYIQEFFARELFHQAVTDIEQWQIQLIRMMETSVASASFSHKAFLKRNEKWCQTHQIPCAEEHLTAVMRYVKEIPAQKFQELLEKGYSLKVDDLDFKQLTESEKKQATKAGFQVKVSVGIVLFVIFCFVTEALPLPMVAFSIGIIGMLSGLVTRQTVAGLYWSDATWFIMGSLMFSVAFVKTGVDKRLALMMFGKLKNPDIKWITLVIIAVISPLTMFMSDHALAAMFLPIGILLYSTVSMATGQEDSELAKMIMITICMACNLGGSLAPSGAARNIIMMSYAEDMFGVSIGYAQWCLYCIPYLFFVIPITWLVINWQFKPKNTNLRRSMDLVAEEINKTGVKWTSQQKISIMIFGVMLFCWITEKNLIYNLTGIRFGIGVIAVMGALAYILFGIVNWRDYQQKVDWGVVWLYAGAIIFGRILVQTGGAYWIARSMLSLVAPLGLNAGIGMLITGCGITGLLTQLMADGPACAAVGPVTLAMAGIMHPGSSMIPFMAMATSIASSLAYCLVIGTPPNAIVYASGYLESKDYLRVGLILWFTNLTVLIVLATIYWPWLGWSGLDPY